MLDGPGVDDGAPPSARFDMYDAPPVAVDVAPDILAHTLTRISDIRVVCGARLNICPDGGLLAIEEQLMDGVRELASGVRHAPEHADHTPDASRSVDFDARRSLVGRGCVWYGFWDAEDIAEES